MNLVTESGAPTTDECPPNSVATTATWQPRRQSPARHCAGTRPPAPLASPRMPAPAVADPHGFPGRGRPPSASTEDVWANPARLALQLAPGPTPERAPAPDHRPPPHRPPPIR